MNLDQITIEIRPRTAWEALDLGLLMARRWWWPLMKVWLIVSFPILLIALLIPTDKWWISALVIWWFKPIYERPLLHILSHAVFNDLPTTRSTLKQFPTQALTQIFLSLTWRRFSPTRSMDLPVLQLEGLRAARRQDRLAILHREDSAPAGWISVLGLLLEISLLVGLITLIWAFIPRELNIEWVGLFFDSESSELIELQLILWYSALGLTAPFYAACGFALYLNRRIKLEAWDIDIAFRRIVNKRRAPAVAPLIGVLLIGLSAFFADAPIPAYADVESAPEQQIAPTHENERELSAQLPQEDTSAEYKDEPVVDLPLGEYQELNRDTAQQGIKDVMQQSEFSRKEIQRRLKQNKEDEVDEEFWDKFFDSLRDFKGFVAAASLLEILLWLAVLAIIGLLVYRYRAWLAAQFVRIAPQPVARSKPVTLFGMDVTRESLPENISESALGLLRTGDTRAALALLYRASLFQLIHQGVDVHDGHTEGECVQLVRDHFAQTKNINTRALQEVRIDYFARLTRMWQQLAYGHVAPETQVAEQLCDTWNNSWLHQTGTNSAGEVK